MLLDCGAFSREREALVSYALAESPAWGGFALIRVSEVFSRVFRYPFEKIVDTMK